MRIALIILFVTFSYSVNAQRYIQEYEPDYNIDFAKEFIYNSKLHDDDEKLYTVMYSQFYSKTCHNKKIKKIERVTELGTANKRYLVESFDNDGFIKTVVRFDVYNNDTSNMITESYSYNALRTVIKLIEIKNGVSFCNEYIVKSFYFNMNKQIDSIRTNIVSTVCPLSTSLSVFYRDTLSRLSKAVVISQGGIKNHVINYRTVELSKDNLKYRLLSNPLWDGKKRWLNNITRRKLSSSESVFNMIEVLDSTNSVVIRYIEQNNFLYYDWKYRWYINSLVLWDGASVYKWKDNGTLMSSFSWINMSPELYQNSYNQLRRNLFGMLNVKRSSGDYLCRKVIYRKGLIRKVVVRKYKDAYSYEYFTD